MSLSNSEPHSAHFKSRLGFILATAGSAVGLGNIWRFPYLVGSNGGALFIFVYLGFVLVLGVPLIMAEISVGRTARANQVHAFKKLGFPKWRVLGIWGVVGQILIMCYYPVVAGWTLHYIFAEVHGPLTTLHTHTQYGAYFNNLIHSYGGSIVWGIVFILLTIFTLARGVHKGIELLSLYGVPLLFVLLIVLDVWALTIPGAGAGVDFYLNPNPATFSWHSVLAAMGQAAFSLSVGLGTVATYGAFTPKDTSSIFRSSTMIAGLDTLVALLAGFVVIPAVFAFGLDPQAGPGLTFITLPMIFHNLPFGQLFGFMFFLLLFIAAITSSVSLAEGPLFWLQQYMRKGKAMLLLLTLYTVGMVLAAYSMGPWNGFTIAGRGIFDWFDLLTSTYMLPLGMLMYSLFVGWFGWNILSKETNTNPMIVHAWKWLLRLVIPILISVVFITGLIS